MSSPIPVARLKKGREKPAANRHPWIFSGAIDSWTGKPASGGVVDVLGPDGQWLGRGLAHPGSDLCIRLYGWNQGEALDDAWFARKIEAAVNIRRSLFRDPARTNAVRLVFSESDGLPGLIADRYADVLSIRVSSRALVPWLPGLVAALRRSTGVQEVIVRPETDSISREQLPVDEIRKLSTLEGVAVEIRENGLRFIADLDAGHKTGFYLDQRDNRLRTAAYARNRSVLSAYCYTGAFEVYAAREGASSIIGLDSSQPALDQAAAHHVLNGFPSTCDYRKADVPEMLRRFRDENRKFGMIILDPPRFVTSFQQKPKGMRAYKDINLLALKLLEPQGILATFSCSGLMTPEDLRTTLAWAAKDAGRTVRIIESMSQPADHPILTSFTESEYLCGYICIAE